MSDTENQTNTAEGQSELTAVVIRPSHSTDVDEICVEFFKCPECGHNYIWDECSFCPGCGKPLEFEIEAD